MLGFFFSIFFFCYFKGQEEATEVASLPGCDHGRPWALSIAHGENRSSLKTDRAIYSLTQPHQII